MRRLSRARAAAAIVLAGVTAALVAGYAVFGASGAAPRTGPVSVGGGLKRAPGAFVRGDGLIDSGGKRTQLASPVSGAMIGPLAPVAVRSPDGNLVAYNTWRELRSTDDRSFSAQGIADGDALGVPSLRIHDEAGQDTLLARGAYSVAWRSDGAVAFVKATDPVFRAGRAYTGQALVQASAHGRAVPWTSDTAHYVVYAWAGRRLLLHRVGLGERLELLVADAPGQVRPLADGSAIAVSPDGSRVAVVGQDGTNVRVLDIATGRELSWLDVTTTTPSLRWVAYSGSWVASHIVAPASAGLAVFDASGDSLRLEQVLSLDETEFPVGVQEPRFSDDAGNEISAVADLPPAHGNGGVSFLLACDRIARICERGAPAPAKEWLRPVDEEGGR